MLDSFFNSWCELGFRSGFLPRALLIHKLRALRRNEVGEVALAKIRTLEDANASVRSGTGSADAAIAVSLSVWIAEEYLRAGTADQRLKFVEVMEKSLRK